VLSAAGIQTSVIPTAILSTHTGGFTGYTFRDLTGDILPTAEHWSGLGLSFDAIYTGFLGSLEQVGIVIEALSILRGGDTVVVVDPVMADFGKLYTIFGEGFPAAMRQLCAKADVITPNLTEAALLTGSPYREGPFGEDEVRGMLRSLAEIGAGRVVLTGVSYQGEPGVIGAASYDAHTDEFAFSGEERVEPMYHGTGDVFASVLTAALVSGRPLADSCAAAVRYTVDCIRRTKAAGTDSRFGVDFESGLCGLRELIGER
jgi:pyridoxine kinase